MIYLENIVFGNSNNRNMLWILNWKLKPQLCKHLGRCSYLCIMNISLQISRHEYSTYLLLLLLLYTKFFTFYSEHLLYVFIPLMKVRPLANFLKLFFVCHISYVIVDALQHSSWFASQLDLISKVECVLYLLYIMNIRTVILSNIIFNLFL